MSVVFVNNYLVESFSKVNLAKYLTASYVMDPVTEMRERVDIKLCPLIQKTIVSDRTKLAIWFWRKMQRRGEQIGFGGVHLLNYTQINQLFEGFMRQLGLLATR